MIFDRHLPNSTGQLQIHHDLLQGETLTLKPLELSPNYITFAIVMNSSEYRCFATLETKSGTA